LSRNFNIPAVKGKFNRQNRTNGGQQEPDGLHSLQHKTEFISDPSYSKLFTSERLQKDNDDLCQYFVLFYQDKKVCGLSCSSGFKLVKHANGR